MLNTWSSKPKCYILRRCGAAAMRASQRFFATPFAHVCLAMMNILSLHCKQTNNKQKRERQYQYEGCFPISQRGVQ
jgi:hypothetical protein